MSVLEWCCYLKWQRQWIAMAIRKPAHGGLSLAGRARLQGRLSIQALGVRLPSAPPDLLRFLRRLRLSGARRRRIKQPLHDHVEGRRFVIAPRFRFWSFHYLDLTQKFDHWSARCYLARQS